MAPLPAKEEPAGTVLAVGQELGIPESVTQAFASLLGAMSADDLRVEDLGHCLEDDIVNILPSMEIAGTVVSIIHRGQAMRLFREAQKRALAKT